MTDENDKLNDEIIDIALSKFLDKILDKNEPFIIGSPDFNNFIMSEARQQGNEQVFEIIRNNFPQTYSTKKGELSEEDEKWLNLMDALFEKFPNFRLCKCIECEKEANEK